MAKSVLLTVGTVSIMRNKAFFLPLLLSLPLAGQTITITMPSVLGPTFGSFFSFTPAASGGTAPYTWTPLGTPLPSGLTIQADGGLISGTPNFAITGYVVRLQASDSLGRKATKDVTFNIRQALDFGPTTAPGGFVGGAYQHCLTATGGTAEIGLPPTYSVLAGTFPDGLTIVNSNCAGAGIPASIMQGTPTKAGTFNFVLQAVDAENRFKQRSFSIIIDGPPSFFATPSSVDFTCSIGSVTACSPSNSVSVILSSSGASLTPISASVSSASSWLTVTCCDVAATPARLTITVTPSLLTQTGTLVGTIQVTGGIGVAAINIPVRVFVTATVGSVVANPASLAFNYTPGGSVAPPQIITITPGTSTNTSFTIATGTNSGGNWLFSNTVSGTTPATISIQVNGNGLASGAYTGQVTITSAGYSLVIPITLNVFGSSLLQVLPLSMTFNVQSGNTQPGLQQQQLTINTSNGLNTYSAQANTISGGAWLVVSPPSGQTPAVVLVGLAAGIPGPGTYSGAITVSAPGLPPQIVLVTLNVTGSASFSVSPATLNFVAPFGGSNPQPLNLNVTSNGSPAAFSLTATTRDSVQWLNVSQSSGITPSIIQVSINAVGLPAGSYSGSILFTASNTVNAQVLIPVNLTVQASSSISATPSTLSFQYQIGGSIPPQQTVQLASSSGAINYTLSASSSGWLNSSPFSGTTPSNIIVSISPISLPAGTYNGSLSVLPTSPSDGALTIPVVLVVTNPPPVASSVTALSFVARIGGGDPPQQTIPVTSTLGATRFTATASAIGGNWLSVSPSAATTPASIVVTINQNGLSTGNYSGSVQLASVDAPSGSITIPVTLSVLTPANPVVKAITSTASFLTGDVAPGMIFTAFGTNLGPDAPTGPQVSAGRVLTNSGNTRVLFNDVPSPILYSSAGQVIGIVPYGMAGQRSAKLVLEYLGIRSAPIDVTIADTAPAIFTANSSGRGQAAALNEDGSLNSSTNPALPGKVVVLFLTGEGAMNPLPLEGQVTALPLPRLVAPVIARMGFQIAQVQYAGAAPGQVAGLGQLNITVPAGIAGDVPVTVNIGGNSSQSAVTIAVKDVKQ